MDHKTERDLDPPDEQQGRRRFMIAGEQIILRALESSDLERCYRWMNDPNIVWTLKSRYPMPFHLEAEWLEKAVRSSHNERHFAIERRGDREHIGNASIHDIDWVSRSAMFGIFIGDPSAWNRGYGSDSIRTLVRFAFQEMNLRKLRINIFDYNDRGRNVLISNGFAEEGKLVREFYRDGAYHDILILATFNEGTTTSREGNKSDD